MATSTAQALATVPVWDYLMNTGDPLSTSPKGLGGKKGKITLTYSLAQSANPVTLLGTDPIPFTTDPNGFWQVNLVPNNKISPTGTLYSVEIEGYRSYLILVTDVNVPGIGWQSAAIAILPPIGGGAPGYTLPGGTTVLGPFTIQGDLTTTGNTKIGGPSPEINVLAPSVTVAGITYPLAAKGDAKQVSDGVIVGGALNILNSATAGFLAGVDVGKVIAVAGAGPVGPPVQAFMGTILSVLSPTQVLLSGNATAAVANATFWYGTDDWQAIQNALDRGGDVLLPAPYWFLTTKTLRLTKSDTALRFGISAKLVFVALGVGGFVAGVNDRAILVIGTESAYRQVAAGAIAIGATTFTAQNGADTADLVLGDWVCISERDAGAGDNVYLDFMQVQSVAGAVVTTASPFRTAFPNARAYVAGTSGLAFRRVTNLVRNTIIERAYVIQPVAAQSNPGIAVHMAMGTLYDRCTVNDMWGQALYGYESADLTLRHCTQIHNGGISSELGAVVDITIDGGTFDFQETPGNLVAPDGACLTVDFGSAFFSIVGARFPRGANAFLQLLYVHDGVVTGNVFGYAQTAGGAVVGQGVTAKGTQAVSVFGNTFRGGVGALSQAVGFGDTAGFTVNILSKDNIGGPNFIGSFGTGMGIPTPGRNDIMLGPGIFGSGVVNPTAAMWNIAGDSSLVNHMLFVDVAAGHARSVRFGPGIGTNDVIGMYDQTGLRNMLWQFYDGRVQFFNGLSQGGALPNAAYGFIFRGDHATYTQLRLQDSNAGPFAGWQIGQGAGDGTDSLNYYNETAASLRFKMRAGGSFTSFLQMYPGDQAGAIQTTGGILHAAGVPSNANGNNNDWCVSDNGHLYFKTGGVWVDMTATVTSQSTPANPALTASLVGVMMGLAGAFTPIRTGSVLITVSGDVFNSIATDGATVQIRTGTGTAPANGVALTGTARGAQPGATSATAAAKTLFSITVIVTGLTLGVAIWIDLALAAVTGGNASVENVTIAASEI